MSRIWTEEENKILEQGCKEYKTSREISEMLVERSSNAVASHIRNLGLNKIYDRGKLEDLTGMTFGNWKVLKRIEDYIAPSGFHQTQYLCECQCKDKTIRPQLAINLKSGKTRSCGCLLGKHISESLKTENKYDLSGEYGIGYTDKGEEFYFDLEDYDLIKGYKWHLDKAGYIVASIKDDSNKNTTIKMHRLIMGITDSNIQVDHIKHKVNDNRKTELRLATAIENGMNKRLLDSNTSGNTGVYFDKRKDKWKAQIGYDGKVFALGSFDDIQDAIKKRKKIEDNLFGEYSYDNSMNYNPETD